MGNISLAASAIAVLRTFPFLLLRLAVYLGLSAAFVVAIGGGAGIGLGLSSLAGSAARAPGAFWGAMGGFAFVAGLLWWLREYLLYFIEISHASALAIVVEGKTLPVVRGQIAGIMTIVQRCFREAHALQTAERSVRKAVADLIADAKPVDALMPRGIQLPENVVNAGLKLGLGFVTRGLLGRTISRATRDPYAGLQDSILRLAQESGILSRNALLLAAASFVASVFVFLFSLTPASALANSIPSGSALVAVAIALVFAWAFRQAIVEPLLVAAFIDLFGRVTEDRDPDPALDEKLTALSEAYREIKAVAAPPQRGLRRGIVA
jgi:hypothetical protein